MRSRTTRRFRSSFAILPLIVQQQTRQAYRLWLDNPRHPSLRFKRLKTANPVCSVRIGGTYRAVGVIVWFWIGPHADYDRLVKRLYAKLRREPSVVARMRFDADDQDRRDVGPLRYGMPRSYPPTLTLPHKAGGDYSAAPRRQASI